MQLAKKSALGLGLVVAMIVGLASTHETRASNHEVNVNGNKIIIELVSTAKEAAKKAPISMTATRWALLGLGLATVPYLINYNTRNPQKEPRFDKDKLANGSFKEKIKQIHYFISDRIVGWPYKNKKLVIKEDDFGKDTLLIQNEQLPGGYLGNIHAWVLKGGGGAIMFPATVMACLGMWSAGIQWWMNPSLEFPDKKTAFPALAMLFANR